MTSESITIAATGAFLPDNVVTNDELAQWLDTSDEWIVEHTGIRERRWSAPADSTSDVGARAVEATLQQAGVDAGDVDLLLCATSSPDYVQPQTAAAIHGKSGLNPTCGAIDLNAVCSGFPHALQIGFALLAATPAWRHVLVAAAECYTKITDPDDRTTSIFFGDGAGAVLLSRAADADGGGAAVLGAYATTDFSRHEAIIVPAGGTAEPLTTDGLEEKRQFFTMRGSDVREFAVAQLPATVRGACEAAGVSVEDLALVVPHQSNLRILEQSASALGLPMEKLHVTVDRYGNTAAASIPITLDDAVRAGRVSAGDLVCLVGYGGGLSSAATVLRWG